MKLPQFHLEGLGNASSLMRFVGSVVAGFVARGGVRMEGVDAQVVREVLLTLRSGGDYGQSADAHYRAIDVDSLVNEMKGDVDALIGFLSGEWDWRITHDRMSRTIIADESKIMCVCPLVCSGLINDPGLCECSREFAARMFRAVVGHEVGSTVVRSILRGSERALTVHRFRNRQEKCPVSDFPNRRTWI